MKSLIASRKFRGLLAGGGLLGLIAVVALVAGMLRLERIAAAEGIVHVTDMDWEGRVVEVEGYDDQMRKLEMILDLRTGKALAKRWKDVPVWLE